MAHPTFKAEDNKEYTATMLGGPYGDNDSTGPVQGKYGPQWKYLVRIGEEAHYWYVTPRTQEMIEKRGYATKMAPFTIVKRVEDGRNKGFELSGESYDTIFPKDGEKSEDMSDPSSSQIEARASREWKERIASPPLSPEDQAILEEHLEQGAPNKGKPISPEMQAAFEQQQTVPKNDSLAAVIARLDKIGGMIKDMKEDMDWVRKNTVPF